MKKIIILTTLLATTSFLYSCSETTQKSQETTETNLAQEVQENTINEKYVFKKNDITATLKTNHGDIQLVLYTDSAPLTTTNFILHSLNDYYDGITFHRIINGFMIQGGDPDGNGRGGESVYGEDFEDEFFDKYQNLAGTIAMANRGPKTNGSQFFINEVDNNFLDKKHSVFGKVTQGFDIVEKISDLKVDVNTSLPENPVVINDVVIEQYNGESFESYSVQDQVSYIQKAKQNHTTLIEQQEKQSELLKQEQEQQLIKAAEEKEKKKIADKQRIAQSGDTVEVKYELKNENGDIIDGNFNTDSLFEFTIDQQGIISGFSNAVKSMKLDETKKVELSPEEAYGEYDETLIQTIKKEQLFQYENAGYEIKAGTKIPTNMGVFVIKEVNGEDVILDMNHQLAGQKLYFTIELKYFVN